MHVSLPVSTPEPAGVFEPDAAAAASVSVAALVAAPVAGAADSGDHPAAGRCDAAAAPADPAGPILIADRAEFIDALRRLRRGHVLVRPRAAGEDEHANCVLDSGVVYTAFQPLCRFGLISEFANPDGFPTMRYYGLTSSGKRFADKALRSWRQRPLLERLAVRLLG